MEGAENVYTQEIRYDECNRVARKIELVGEDYRAYESKYMYDLENKPTEIQLGDERTRAQYGYDKLGRLERRTIRCRNGIYDTKYKYQSGGYGAKSTTGTVEKIEQPGHNFDYTIRGGIAAVRHNGVHTGYQYDDIGQLKRVNDEAQQKTFTYKYDQGGNILRKSEHAYTTKQKAGPALSTVEYGYSDAGWKDMLTSYDGVPVQSDAIGNVLDDGTWQYTWEAGRRLAQMDAKDGSDALAFAYNASGLRVRKESRTRGVTEYTLSGAQIVHQRRGNVEMHFFYADGNSPAMVTYRGITYGYVYNLQGDVVALVELNGHCPEAVAYTYDAWGKQVSCTGPMAETLGRENPFRYRGYVFDEETGLYYLRTRYYNPEWGRFISADGLLGDLGELGAHNLFAYCRNSPVSHVDPDGQDLLALIGAGLGGAKGGYDAAGLPGIWGGMKNGIKAGYNENGFIAGYNAGYKAGYDYGSSISGGGSSGGSSSSADYGAVDTGKVSERYGGGTSSAKKKTSSISLHSPLPVKTISKINKLNLPPNTTSYNILIVGTNPKTGLFEISEGQKMEVNGRIYYVIFDEILQADTIQPWLRKNGINITNHPTDLRSQNRRNYAYINSLADQVTPSSYETAEAAARRWSESNYPYTLATGLERVAAIYFFESNPEWGYYLTSTEYGQPHSARVPGVPKGATLVAGVHTHPMKTPRPGYRDRTGFSNEDINYVRETKVDLYVIDDGRLGKLTSKPLEALNLGQVDYAILTQEQIEGSRTQVVKDIWLNHKCDKEKTNCTLPTWIK